MAELIDKANQAILESQCLRRERCSLRLEASALVSQLGQTVARSQNTEEESASLKVRFDQAFSKP
jgi:hypothetical protein